MSELDDWKRAQERSRQAARRKFARLLLPALVPALVLGGILGLIHRQDVQRRREVEARLGERIPAERIETARATLQRAAARIAADDEQRGRALAQAYAALEPRPDLGACTISSARLGRNEVLTKMGFTSATSGPGTTEWHSKRWSDADFELRQLDRKASEQIGFGADRGNELVAHANAIESAAPPEVDFQFVIEEHTAPEVGGSKFTGGHMKGVLLVYDRRTNSVPCAATIEGESSDSVRVLVKSPLGPQDPAVAVGGDLAMNAFRNVTEKLVAAGPRRSAHAASTD